MTFRFIDEHKDWWPVRLLCDTLEVSPAGYYAWRQRPRSARQQRRDTLLVEIRAAHTEAKARYGSPRIHAELVARGHDCCVNTVAKLMRDNGIAAKPRRSSAAPPQTPTTTCPWPRTFWTGSSTRRPPVKRQLFFPFNDN